MSFTLPMKFDYGLNIKLNMAGPDRRIAIGEVFPSIEDLVVKSREFDTFEAAVDSANGLMTDIAGKLNAAVGDNAFKIATELNPRLTGQQTLSQDWHVQEIAKLWIVPQAADPTAGKPIRAIGLCRVSEVLSDPVRVS
jgi:hypothetical protein